MSSFTGTSAAETITTTVVSPTVSVRGTSLLPSLEIDTVFAGGGNDFVRTGGGNDIAYLGSGDDVFLWNPGDGSDFVDGQTGVDALRFNGSNAAEQIRLERGLGTGLALIRNIGAIRMTLQGMERIELTASGGADGIAIGDLTGTSARAVTVDLAGIPGSGVSDSQADSVSLVGSSTGETVVLTNTGSGIAIAGLAASVSIAALETFDGVSVAAQGGDDTLDARGITAVTAVLTLNGGEGADSLFGSLGADVLIGDTGNDNVTGGRGNDTAFLGAGDDSFVWRPGDGSDLVEGQDGFDTLEFVGANVAEIMTLAANGGRAQLLRDVGNIVMDLNDVERVALGALSGADTVTFGDLTGTDVARVDLDLAGGASPTIGDGVADSVVVNGTNGSDTIEVALDAGAIRLSGLAAEFRIANADTIDLLTIRGGGGDDVINATALASQVVVTLDGGLGFDVLIGGDGAELAIGGDANDVAFLGAGDDRFFWQPGDDNDVIEGQSGFDTLDFRASNASELIDIMANGGRAVLFRNIGNVTQDMNDVERVSVTALGGADAITVNDLSGTDVSAIEIVLNADGQADVVTVRGTAGDDVIVVVGDASGISVLGLAARVDIVGFEPGLDRLVIESLGGNDTIEASGVTSGSMLLTLNGGDNDDVLVGGGGDDILLGGNGDDVLLGGAGLDLLDGGPGNNVVIQGASALAPQGGVEVAEVTLVGASEASMSWFV